MKPFPGRPSPRNRRRINKSRKPRPPVVIEVCERLMDRINKTFTNGSASVYTQVPAYHSQREGGKSGWGRGESVAEAVDSLICSHPELIGMSREECNRLGGRGFGKNPEKYNIKIVYLGLLGR